MCQRRIALERELSKDALECKEIVEMLKEVGLMRIVCELGTCDDKLVKEFVVTATINLSY